MADPADSIEDFEHLGPQYRLRGAAIDAAVAAERERCANLVPTNWCDPLLTGKDAPSVPLDCPGVERLLRGIQDRIRSGVT